MDSSDSVAFDVLDRGGADSPALRFRPRSRLLPVLFFGSWGVVIVVPMLFFIANGELPAAPARPAVLAVFAVGLALVYAAARGLLVHAHLELHGGELLVRRGPLWPWRVRRWRLGDVEDVRFELQPDSFRHPATWRGLPTARPYRVVLRARGGGEWPLPLALGARDASEVARWIADRLRGA